MILRIPRHPTACRINSSVGLGLHDKGTLILWSKSDEEYLLKQFAKVREESQARKLLDKLHSKTASGFELSMPSVNKNLEALEERLNRVANDQTAYDDHARKYIEPLDMAEKDDLLVTTGLSKLAQLVTGESERYFSHFASGTSTVLESRDDTTLKAENARVSMFDSGYQTASGGHLKFAGFFTSGIPSATITEGAVFDDPDAGSMLFRTVYNTPLSHIQYETVYTLTQSILTTSVTKVV